MIRRTAGIVGGLIALMAFVQPAIADDLQVKVVSISSVATTGTITLVVQTDPGATCGGDVHWQYQGSISDSVLRQKAASKDGMVDWSWTAPASAARGDITIACAAGGRNGKASASVSVQ